MLVRYANFGAQPASSTASRTDIQKGMWFWPMGLGQCMFRITEINVSRELHCPAFLKWFTKLILTSLTNAVADAMLSTLVASGMESLSEQFGFCSAAGSTR